jgi:hypothetical protein
MDIIGICAFDTNLQAQDLFQSKNSEKQKIEISQEKSEQISRYFQSLAIFGRSFTERSASPLFFTPKTDFIYFFTPQGRKVKEALKIVKGKIFFFFCSV